MSKMNKLFIEMSVTSEATPGKPILQAKIPIEALSTIKVSHGETAVKEYIWGVFSRIMDDLRKNPK